MYTHPITSRLDGSSTVYVNPVRLRKSSAWRCRSARFSSGVISRGQLLSSHPGVARMCSADEVHASSPPMTTSPSGVSTRTLVPGCVAGRRQQLDAEEPLGIAVVLDVGRT